MDPYRLPRAATPSRYDLRLEPDLAAATFVGRVSITLNVHEAVTGLQFNSAELQIFSAALEDAAGASHSPAIELDEAAERCRLTFDRPLPPGPARLTLHFAGALGDKLRGFYLSRTKDAAGQGRLLAVTQFEATDARRAFPCWDEPAFKAVFSCTLVVEPGLTALSNTPAAEETTEGGKRVVRFADTIPMSTYLVAFVVGELEASDPVMVGETPLRVWCVPGKRRLTKFAQEVGAFSLGLFEEYYGRKYPGNKLDLIAVPDFAFGAMENLGAIVFRETALLVDEASATHAEKERVADVVAHENAHLWFGDLVTMAWWNGLWLNEAFATFMEMLAVDAFKPQWRRWTAFGVSRSAALAVDGLRSTRPVEYPVAAPRDADAMFDVLTYEKGASVLRMLEQYVGPDAFRAGVRAYLDRHAYGNAETADLWRALEGATRQPVPAILDGWVFRPGYPLLTARLDGGALVLAQQRFSYLPPPPEEASQRWQVPVQVRVDTSAGPEVRRLLLTEAEARLTLPDGAGAVVVNEGGHGFYRVRYAPELLGRLLARLPALTPVERFNLVNDAWAATLAGLAPLADYLDLTAHFAGERDANVWTVLVTSLQALNRIVEDADRPALQGLVRARLGPAVAELGWRPRPGEDELTGRLRADLLRAAGTLGDDPDVQRAAEGVFAEGADADPGVLSAAIAVLAHAGDEARYDDFVGRFRAAPTPQEEQRYLQALAGFRPPGLVGRTLEKALNGEVRTQDAPLLLRSLLYGVHSRAQAWAFVQAHWAKLAADFPPLGVRRLFEGVQGLTTPAWEREVQAFVQGRHVNLGGKAVEQHLEQLRVAVALREREGPALRAPLLNRPGAPS